MTTRLRELREQAGLSQPILAARADISLRALQRYEDGEMEPTAPKIVALCHALGVDPSALLGWQAPKVDEPVITDEAANAAALPRANAVGEPVPPAPPLPAFRPGTVPSHYR